MGMGMDGSGAYICMYVYVYIYIYVFPKEIMQLITNEPICLPATREHFSTGTRQRYKVSQFLEG